MKHRYVIGIDPGVKTGVAFWDREEKRLIKLDADSIILTMNGIRAVLRNYGNDVLVRIEDARKRKWFGKSGREVLQGAGSIKRDCQIWEEFLKDAGANYEFVAPKNNKTKLSAADFKKISKYEGKTNEHSRDAAMLVIGL